MLKKKFDLTDQTAGHEFHTEFLCYHVKEPKTNTVIYFTLGISRDDEGSFVDANLMVDISPMTDLACYELFNDPFKNVEEVKSIIANAGDLDGWETSSTQLTRNLEDHEFFWLLPKKVMQVSEHISISIAQNSLEDCGKIDWFGDGEDAPWRGLLPYIEDLAISTVNYCAEEWKKAHKE